MIGRGQVLKLHHESTQVNGSAIRGGSRKRRRNIRYGKIGLLLMSLILLVMGIAYAFSGMTDLIKTMVAPPPISVIKEPVQLLTIQGSPDSKEQPTRFLGQVSKVAYITFDDGPSKYTGQLLDIMNHYDAKATFFMVGENLEHYPEAVNRLANEGNYPGLHSMTHSYKKLYKSGSSDNFLNEFKEVQNKVEALIGYTPHLIRAPYGSSPQIGEAFRADIAAAGFKMWDWTTDSLDWNLPGQPDKIISRIHRGVHRDIEVILLHERKQTVEALPQILKLLRAKGYEFEVYNPNEHVIVNFSHDTRL